MFAAPEITGEEVKTGTPLEATTEEDQRLKEPRELVRVVLAVTNIPVSAEVWVYVDAVAPLTK